MTNTYESAAYAEESDASLRAYPNPVKDYLNITFEGLTEAPAQSAVTIVDGIGRMYTAHTTWYSQESRLELDFSGMKEGIYLINVRTATGSKTLRIMKQSE
jgi:hypothetical protein